MKVWYIVIVTQSDMDVDYDCGYKILLLPKLNAIFTSFRCAHAISCLYAIIHSIWGILLTVFPY